MMFESLKRIQYCFNVALGPEKEHAVAVYCRPAYFLTYMEYTDWRQNTSWNQDAEKYQ